MGFQKNFLPLHPDDRKEMLKSLGLDSIEELFACVPEEIRLQRELKIPAALSEWDLENQLRKLASKNSTVYSHLNFIGGGMYEHHIPAVVDALSYRGEFLTAYTPYQPEMSQGLLQALFEYQQALSGITGLPCVNSSSYDGGTALAEAAWIGCAASKKKNPIVLYSTTLWDPWQHILKTYLQAKDVQMIAVQPCKESGRVDVEHLEENIKKYSPAVFLFQTPNQYGLLEDVKRLAKTCRTHGVVSALSFNPLISGLFPTPGAAGVDIATCEGQVLGIPLSAGGPSLGVLACKKEFRKYMPGRLVGKVEDIYGKPAYALVYEDREQHVAREKATSNICSNQAWCALRAVIYLSLVGETGLPRLAKINSAKAHYLMDTLTQLPGVSLAFRAPFFNEFTLSLPRPAEEVLKKLMGYEIFGGLKVSDAQVQNGLLIAVTETKSRQDLDQFAEAFKNALEL